jgi:hypothetical protein
MEGGRWRRWMRVGYRMHYRDDDDDDDVEVMSSISPLVYAPIVGCGG